MIACKRDPDRKPTRYVRMAHVGHSAVAGPAQHSGELSMASRLEPAGRLEGAAQLQSAPALSSRASLLPYPTVTEQGVTTTAGAAASGSRSQAHQRCFFSVRWATDAGQIPLPIGRHRHRLPLQWLSAKAATSRNGTYLSTGQAMPFLVRERSKRMLIEHKTSELTHGDFHKYLALAQHY